MKFLFAVTGPFGYLVVPALLGAEKRLPGEIINGYRLSGSKALEEAYDMGRNV